MITYSSLPPTRTIDSFLGDEGYTTDINAGNIKLNHKKQFSSTKRESNQETQILSHTDAPQIDIKRQELLSSKVSFFFNVNTPTIKAPILDELKHITIDDEMDYSKSLVEQGPLKEHKVMRFGRMYKRKIPSKLGYQYIQKIEGYRFCKFCNANLPLSAFYTSYKRYVCRRHHYLRVRKRTIEIFKENEIAKFASKSWLKLNENKFFLGYDKVRYDIGDIRLIFQHLAPMVQLDVLHPVIVPIDFTKRMRPSNVAAISYKAFNMLMDLMTFAPSRIIFIAFVQKVNLIPKNFDVSYPHAPFRDPNFCRQDIDLHSILDEDKDKIKIEGEHQDNDYIMECGNKDNSVPWLNCIELPAGEAGYWKDGKPIETNSRVVEVDKLKE